MSSKEHHAFVHTLMPTLTPVPRWKATTTLTKVKIDQIKSINGFYERLVESRVSKAQRAMGWLPNPDPNRNYNAHQLFRCDFPNRAVDVVPGGANNSAALV